MSVLKTVCLVVILFVMSCWDLKKKEIPLILLLTAGTILGGVTLIVKDITMLECLLGGGIGVLFIGISKWTKGALGMGDSITILIVTMTMGIYYGLVIVFYSMLLAAVLSIVLLVCKRVNKKDTLPYLPFVFFSTLGVLL